MRERADCGLGGAGDVNGDGIDDLIIGARGSNDYAGETYVFFGSAAGFAASLDLAALDGTDGFILAGTPRMTSGSSRARARGTSTATASTI